MRPSPSQMFGKIHEKLTNLKKIYYVSLRNTPNINILSFWCNQRKTLPILTYCHSGGRAQEQHQTKWLICVHAYRSWKIGIHYFKVKFHTRWRMEMFLTQGFLLQTSALPKCNRWAWSNINTTSSKYHSNLFKVPHHPLQITTLHPLQSITPPSSKYLTTLFKLPHHPLQSTTSPLQSNTPPSSKYHTTSSK